MATKANGNQAPLVDAAVWRKEDFRRFCCGCWVASIAYGGRNIYAGQPASEN